MLPHQQKWWELDTFYKLMLGGYGSGKTYIGALRSIYLSYLNAPIAGMYVSPSYGLSQKTIVITLKEIMNRTGLDYSYNQMKGEFHIRNWDGHIWLGSGDRPESLQGMNISWAGIDEPFIQKKDVFDQVTARVRHPKAKSSEIFLTGTPEQMNWGYELTNRTDIDLGVVVGSTLDNEHLSEEYKTNLLTAYSKEQIDAYVYGKFVNLTQGRVYSEFDRNKHLAKRDDVKSFPIIICMDFNVDYASAILIYKGNGWYHIFKEYRMMNATTYDMAEAMIKDVPDGYDEELPGRPAIKLSRYDTDQANTGRDPLGKAGLTADDTPKRTNNVSTFALEENSRMLKRLSLTGLRGKQQLTEDEKPSILDEKNIIDE